MRLRQLIFDTAAGLGEPAYVTTTGSGSTFRIDRRWKHPTQYAMYFHCRTSLVDDFRAAFPNRKTSRGRSGKRRA
jgi:hypothetical protein